MNIFITGATGYIGQKLAYKLADDGNIIHAFVRDKEKGKLLLDHKNIHLFRGDILDVPSLMDAMRGCDMVYHLAALASVWNKDPGAFNHINVNGLKNVLDCCIALNISNFLFTSTAGVAGHSYDGQPVSEFTNPKPKLETLYERSKVDAEVLFCSYLEKGIRGIIVNPTRVFGPGLLTESNGITRLIKMYINGQWKINPSSGATIGNYVYIDDITSGILKAAEKAKTGERYLLGGNNINYNDFFALIDEITGKKRKMYNLPLHVMLLLSRLQLLKASLFNKQPLITPSFVRKYNKNWIVTSQKAEQELGYTITPLREGLNKTINWLVAN